MLSQELTHLPEQLKPARNSAKTQIESHKSGMGCVQDDDDGEKCVGLCLQVSAAPQASIGPCCLSNLSARYVVGRKFACMQIFLVVLISTCVVCTYTFILPKMHGLYTTAGVSHSVAFGLAVVMMTLCYVRAWGGTPGHVPEGWVCFSFLISIAAAFCWSRTHTLSGSGPRRRHD